ncbi:SpoIID/LytB domain-containing protein, partial [Candidatus Aminicenantes bacterium AH-873-B07]|nr:SpoIID/LytB domain-containing protein [Candidatus Aminicenantes bacterium AH-873-B07]
MIKIKYYKYIVIFSLIIFFLVLNPLEFANEKKEFFRNYSIRKPIIKIGLGINLEEIKIKASSGMKIYEIRNGLNQISDNIDEVLIKGKKEKLNERFLIQFPPFREKEEAKALVQKIREKIKVDIYIDQDLAMNTYQVWIGYFDLKNEAVAFAKKLYNLGFRDAWIVKEEITEGESKPFWLFCNGEFIKLSPDSNLYIIPAHPRSYLSFNGKPYRGIFVVKSTVKGIVLINILNMEDYLKGVVPVELSPYAFNEIEAQKAQAVAARTYALKNLGMYKELGFDLIDTPKCQVYGGISVENPLSTKAVEETKGEVITYRGKLINALYTSTCGGSTENVENVFLGRAAPYLRGTQCFYEHQREWWIKGYYLIAPIYVNGFNISPEISRLISWGIIPLNINHAFYRKLSSGNEVSKWFENTLSFLNRKHNPISFNEKYINYANLAHLIIDSFGWEEKLNFLLKDEEIDYLIRDLMEVKHKDKKYIAY